MSKSSEKMTSVLVLGLMTIFSMQTFAFEKVTRGLAEPFCRLIDNNWVITGQDRDTHNCANNVISSFPVSFPTFTIAGLSHSFSKMVDFLSSSLSSAEKDKVRAAKPESIAKIASAEIDKESKEISDQSESTPHFAAVKKLLSEKTGKDLNNLEVALLVVNFPDNA